MQDVVIAGAAGLVGQNLIPRLKALGRYRITAIDKHAANMKVLRELHPDVTAIEADMAEGGEWEAAVERADAVVLLQAQIGGLDPRPFERNNIASTRRALSAIMRGEKPPYLLHVSSSVVNSLAVDLYTESKKAQEKLILDAGLPAAILRPTLMFGWFDRKHLGWLKRFMEKTPVFPIPGDGRFLRQPLYAGDFAAICAACIDRRMSGAWNISGLQKLDYIDLIKQVKDVSKARARIVKIPYGLFWLMLAAYAVVDRDPPFTTAQLRALATPDVFEVIDWPGIFQVTATPLRSALEETFLDPRFSSVTLEF